MSRDKAKKQFPLLTVRNEAKNIEFVYTSKDSVRKALTNLQIVLYRNDMGTARDLIQEMLDELRRVR